MRCGYFKKQLVLDWEKLNLEMLLSVVCLVVMIVSGWPGVMCD